MMKMYSIANLAAIAPILSVIIVITVIRYIMVIPDDCPAGGVGAGGGSPVFASPMLPGRRGNPLFCGRNEWVDLLDAAFWKSYNAIHEGVPGFDGVLSPGVEPEARLRALAKERYDFEEERLKKAAVIQPSTSDVVQKQTVSNDAQAKTIADPLKEKSGLYTEVVNSLKSLIKQDEQNRWAKLTAASREAKARITWVGAIGLQMVITVLAIAGGIWILVTSIEEQSAVPSPSAPAGASAPPSYLKSLGVFALLVLLITIIWYVLIGFVYKIITDRYMVPLGIWPIIPTFSDNISKYIEDFLMPGVSKLIQFANWLLAIGGIVLIIAVSSTLLQRPNAKRERIVPPPGAGMSDLYQEFLTRCFERLKIGIYLGAVVLVVCVVQMNSWYAWPASLIPQANPVSQVGLVPQTNSIPQAGLAPIAVDADPLDQLGKTVNEVSGQLALEYGLAFTVVLVAMYLPALVILRRRAWQLVRSRNPASSIADQQDWLVKRNLAFSVPQTLIQSLVVLSPAAFGSLLHFFDFLSTK